MPSPFPGMNPYLEHEDAWHNFHQQFTDEMVTVLEAQVGPAYFVKLDDHIYVHEVPDEDRRYLGRADAFVGESDRGGASGTSAAAVADLPTAMRVTLPSYDFEHVPFVEIRDRLSRRLVTVIELLSPSNKRPGRDRFQYEAKRWQILASPTNLVEIDLLRVGPRMRFEGEVTGIYGVFVSRASDRPRAEWYPIELRDPLPTVPVPLGEDVPPAIIDLQAILHQLYDIKGYAKFIYALPPAPPLTPEDAAWARGVLANVGITASPLTPSA